MMTETRPIPDIAKTAYALVMRDAQRMVDLLGTQTVTALGFTEDDNWSVDFTTGLMTREVPDLPDAPTGEG